MTDLISRGRTFLTGLLSLRGSLHVDIGADHRGAVLIAGSGRSGTTWLAELINSDNGFRDIFEPFNPTRVGLVSHFRRRQYLRQDNLDPRFVQPARQIFCGKIRGAWTDRFNRRLLCRRRLIKDIRANLMLKWISTHFGGMPIIFLLRHPCAVALSRRSQGWKSAVALRDLMSQEALVTDYLMPFSEPLAALQSDFERHIAVWCIENLVPVRSLHRGDALVVFYEDVCRQPRRELQRIAEYLKMPSSDYMMKRLETPSSQTRRGLSPIAVGKDLIGSWKERVGAEELNQATNLLKMFGLSHVYGAQPLPLADPGSLLRSNEHPSPELAH